MPQAKKPQSLADLDVPHLQAIRNTVNDVLTLASPENHPDWEKADGVRGPTCRHKEGGHTIEELEDVLAALDGEIRATQQ